MNIRQLDPQRQSSRAQQLTDRFAIRIIGQPQATEALITVLEKYQSGFYDKTKPIASLLFLGPTGVGKTGTAEAFAEGLFGNPKHLMKVDCAEFQHGHEIAKLTGSPPGYLGHRETHPFFTNIAINSFRKHDTHPDLLFTIIVFDEIEKASDALWNLLLGILDKGVLSTGTNEIVDLTACIIIMTSNVGSTNLADEHAIGFDSGAKIRSDAQMKEIALAAARQKFMPEFLNRLDHIVMFRSLSMEDIQEILGLELRNLRDRIILQSHTMFDVSVSPAALNQLIKEGYDRRYNARNLKRTVDKYISLPLGRLVSTSQITSHDIVVVDFINEEWRYYAHAPIARSIATGGVF